MQKNHIIKMISGSHLYGLNTQDSDQDFKGIFLPTRREVILGRTPATIQASTGTSTSKNTNEDVDLEMFSLYQFIKLACDGQTCALEMLWTPQIFWQYQQFTPIWETLRWERHRFLSKNMKAFVGYARAQAAKYSLKGDRLNKLQEFSRILANEADPFDRMHVIWDRLPRDDERQGGNCRELQIAGKWFGETTAVTAVYEVVEKTIARYGKRTAAAASVGGSDWKALSHALRVSLQCEDLMLKGSMEFPHPEPRRSRLLAIKLGQVSMEEVSDEIDESLARVESFAKSSTLPEKVDRNWWDDWLVATVGEYVL